MNFTFSYCFQNINVFACLQYCLKISKPSNMSSTHLMVCLLLNGTVIEKQQCTFFPVMITCRDISELLEVWIPSGYSVLLVDSNKFLWWSWFLTIFIVKIVIVITIFIVLPENPTEVLYWQTSQRGLGSCCSLWC